MAVCLEGESPLFKFVIISDRPKPSKNNFTEKPSKDKELRDNNMSTSSSSPPPSNEKLEKNQDNQNSQVANKLPEVKVDDSPNNNGDSPKEQENEEKSSRLTIKVPSKSSSPQLVASPSELRAKTPEPVSPSSNFFKKLGNMIRSTSDNENTVNTARSIDENKKEGEDKKNTPEPTAVKQRTGSLANLVNTKMFITRTSSLLKEVFDSIDRKMYPDMEPDWVAENQKKSNREAAISEREQLLENKDVEITNDKSQSPQSTQNVMAEVGVALNERKEKLENIGERTEELSNHASDFASLAKQIREKQEQKSKWSLW
ncbi:8248_t:CDS:2 [Rhizophagus irregularis]|nr:8248_t:CDS:2 [Rhizophagus irregularis]